MRNLVAICALLVVTLTSAVAAENDSHRYRFGFIYGLGNIKAAEKPNYTFNHNWGFAAGLDGRRSSLTFSFLSQKNYSDSSQGGHFGFFSAKDEAERQFKSLRAGFDFDYRLRAGGIWTPIVGIGLGYLIWNYSDPVGDTVVQTLGKHDNRVDFSAAEMYLSGGLGVEVKVSSRVTANLKTSVDFLTGLGTAFSDSVNDARGRTMMRVGVMLTYGFGGRGGGRPVDESWPSRSTWTRQQEDVSLSQNEGDSDGDGIDDKRDKCPGTPPGAIVDKFGCALDSDGDGVVDGLDECAQTPKVAAGFVDIFGCPVDADFDGVPDYRDTCLSSPEGVAVDEYGCPLDSDGDGVYDGRDDCPGTEPGIEVDERGCIDIAFLRDTLRINIEYVPGSFEVDMRTRDRLQPLIKKLKILTDVRISILGFTDNVGPAEANQSLSQKRANRMMDWLVTQGIAAERMTAIGKGETNFVASNQTADGRALNRRLEFIFSR